MSSSEDDDALALLLLVNNQRRRQRRRYWVHPVWLSAQENRFFTIMNRLQKFPDRFHDVYKMSQECFKYIIFRVRNEVEKMRTNWREPVCPEERVLITLRYFADGLSFKSLSTYFFRGHSTVYQIVHETARVMWDKLQPDFMPTPTTEKWLEVAERFYRLWNMPNCTGSIDGKHIKIKAPIKSGSAYINYKGYFSIVLLAVVDADSLFLTIDVGEYGRNSDGRAFQVSNFGKALERGELNLPDPAPLPGETRDVPYYFVADEAFPIKNNVMKPFARAQLTNDRREFNNRLSRARKSVECAFGMVRTKFCSLSTPLCCDPERVDTIIQAMCVVHNVVRRFDGKFSEPRTDNILIGEPLGMQQNLQTPQEIREYLAKYFKERAPIPFQDRHNI